MAYDPLDVEGNRERRQQSAARDRDAARQLAESCGRIMETQDGRAFVRRLLDEFYDRDSVYDVNAVAMGAKASRHQWAVQFRRGLEDHHPDLFDLMNREDRQRNRADGSRNDPTSRS